MSYKTVHIGGQDEIEEKKSRFIATVQPVDTENDALDFLAAIRKKYWDARHNCYAYVIGRNNELQRCSDDGEPAGTAGKPILDILLKEEIHNCIIVVTRYFGGTLLGTGGLVRAYQKAARKSIAASVIIEKHSGQKFTIRTDYNSIGKLQYITSRDRIPTSDTRYTDIVEMDIIVPTEKTGSFCSLVTEVTGGRAKILQGDPIEYAETDDDILLFGEE